MTSKTAKQESVFSLDDAMHVLARTPAVLQDLVGGLGERWTSTNYGPETFSPFDVVGHLIHGERTDWMPRARTILDHGESKAFEPFDRFAMYEASRGKSIDDLIATFTHLRAGNLVELRSLRLTEEQLALRGKHPELGTVTLAELLATWVVHDLNHVHQVVKSMAFQYREAVGPWRAYLPLLPKG